MMPSRLKGSIMSSFSFLQQIIVWAEVGADAASLRRHSCLSPIAVKHDCKVLAIADACTAAGSVH